MKGKRQFIRFFSGFAITSLVVLLVCFGVDFMLHIIGSFELSSQILVFYTSIFYGIVFLVARAGARMKNNRLNPDLTEENLLDETESLSKKNSIIPVVRGFLWLFFAAFSVLWLTPALVVYWSAPIYPEKMTTLLGSLFGLGSAAIYYAAKNDKFPLIMDRLLFLIGTCLGLLTAGRIVS
jgi:hypothetical protein